MHRAARPDGEKRWAHGLIGLAALVAATLPAPAANAAACPAPVSTATRLLVGVAQDMSSSSGEARLYLRNSVDDPWRATSTAIPVTLGRNGLGWSFSQTELAGMAPNDKGPIKVEGDGKSTAGLFPAGRPFGFRPSTLKGYLRIRPGTICVDDPTSADYNTVLTPKVTPAGISHENMWEIALYRAGIDIMTPTSQAARSGSCIFFHVWRSPDSGTSGCIGASQADVVRVQHFFDGEPSAIALLPFSSLGILAPCRLPEWPDSSEETAEAAR